jgi:hypothetical protein
MPMTENFNQDANGNTQMVGVGAAGTPDAGVLTIQGITGGTSIPVTPAPASTATITSVASTTSTVVLKAANVNRKGLVLYNNSTKTCFVAFAATSTNAAFTVLMQANSLYEMQTLYTGTVSAIWQNTNGAMLVTELV